MIERPRRCFEDLLVGEKRRSRALTVDREDMIAFARQYDPQWFHADSEAAKSSVFGEVVASGIYILALLRRLDHEINGDIDFVCGVGWDDFRISTALRAGDVITVTSEILELTPSRRGLDRGTAITHYAVHNQDGNEVIHLKSINLVHTRAARAGTPPLMGTR